MPELAEVRFSSDIVNLASNCKKFKVSLNTKSKVKTDLSFSNWIEKDNHWNIGNIFSNSRGKELKITFKNENQEESLLFSMGMSGYTIWNPIEEPLHWKILIETDTGNLYFVDTRCFAKWKWLDEKWTNGWTPDRGPDPTYEWEQFVLNIYNHQHLKLIQTHTVAEALLNQTIGNGIGNYLRSTLLYYWDKNPFQPLINIIQNNDMTFFELCRDIPLTAYSLGGGQLKDWKSPFNVDPTEFKDWVYYKKGSSCCDKSGRRFWFNPKWNHLCPYDIL